MKRVEGFGKHQVCPVCGRNWPGEIIEIPLVSDVEAFQGNVRVHLQCLDLELFDIGGVRFLHQRVKP